MRRTTRAAVAVAVTAALLAATGCGAADTPAASSDRPADPSATGTPGNGSAAVTGTVTVFAAASLTGSFTRLGKDFEAAHPGVKVVFSFAGSSALAQQLNQGAPADVFASAAATNMDQVTGKGTVTTFARNKLEIAVPEGNPAGITGLADFTDPDRKIALCAEQVPCGAAARKVFDAARLTPQPDSLELDVKAALTKVSLGEVDAALVYTTDVLAAKDKVDGIAFTEADQAVNDYPIATLTEAPNPAGAQAFVEHVRSARGRQILAEAGFGTP